MKYAMIRPLIDSACQQSYWYISWCLGMMNACF